MTDEIDDTCSNVLKLVKDCEWYYKTVKRTDITIEGLHIIRDDDGKPIALEAIIRHSSQ